MMKVIKSFSVSAKVYDTIQCSSPMRIVFVSNIFPPHVRGGYELGCQRIAERCHELSHEVTVLTSVAIGRLAKTAQHPILCVEELFEPVYEYEEKITDLACQLPTSSYSIRRQEAFGGILEHNAWTLSRAGPKCNSSSSSSHSAMG